MCQLDYIKYFIVTILLISMTTARFGNIFLVAICSCSSVPFACCSLAFSCEFISGLCFVTGLLIIKININILSSTTQMCTLYIHIYSFLISYLDDGLPHSFIRCISLTVSTKLSFLYFRVLDPSEFFKFMVRDRDATFFSDVQLVHDHYWNKIKKLNYHMNCGLCLDFSLVPTNFYFCISIQFLHCRIFIMFSTFIKVNSFSLSLLLLLLAISEIIFLSI